MWLKRLLSCFGSRQAPSFGNDLPLLPRTPAPVPALPSASAATGAVAHSVGRDLVNSGSTIDHFHKTADPSIKMRSGLQKWQAVYEEISQASDELTKSRVD
ncbi:hypothetical protein CF319_g2043 [Tilletia indica]|nr:hypothetical protein CF319_g2043 [Tilletia indica]